MTLSQFLPKVSHFKSKTVMNAKTLEAITKHGNSLLAAFPNCTEQDPVALCKKLRRIENAVSKPILDYCNGACAEQAVSSACKSALDKLRKLGLPMEHVFINRDPRGYALKLNDDWTRKHNNALCEVGNQELQIDSDWGGYGILAPDLTA